MRQTNGERGGGAHGRSSRPKQPGRLSLARRAARDLLELAEALSRDPAICTDGPPTAGLAELALQLELPGWSEPDEARSGAAAVAAAALRGPDASGPVDARRERLALSLLAQLEGALRQASRSGPPLVQGEAWCLRCRAAGCPHSAPPDRQSIFAGYTATGTPRWESFSSRLLSLAPERVDRLYGPYAEVVALVQPGQELCRDLLPEFGRASDGFQLLGQVDVGFFDLGRERICASFQALRVHPRGGSPRLLLHAVGLAPRELEVEPEELGGLDPLLLRDLLRSTTGRLEGLLLRSVGLARGGERPPSPEELALGVLSRLKGGLERMFRQRGRRTRHAGERRQEPGRPIEQALRDAIDARAEELLFDPRRGTVIVLGPRGRVHVFSASAQLVTSLKLDRDAIRRRMDRERWREATIPEAAAFRSALQARLGQGDLGQCVSAS